MVFYNLSHMHSTNPIPMTTPNQTVRHRSPLRGPWRWVPSLYFIEGLPNVIVVTLSVVMYKRLGLSNEDITFYTSWLYLPWMIKPFWSPLVEAFGSRRSWVLTMQWVMGAAMAAMAFALPLGGYVKWTLALFWLIAFSSATHDIAADGYYMERLTARQQSFFVGIRSTFYRIAMIAGQGLLLMFVGRLEILTKSPVKPWMITFTCVGVLLILFGLYHRRAMLPSKAEKAPRLSRGFLLDYLTTFGRFFTKPGVVAALLFMMCYRLPEALLTKICPLFFLDEIDRGGLALTTGDIGLVQGTVGVLGLLLGGVLGGVLVSRHGFNRWLWPMVCAISLPNVVYVILAYYQPQNLIFISSMVFVEQLGYGFGFTAYMLFLLYYAKGAHETAHYAFCTGFMTLGMMLPGLFAGFIQTSMGYLNFFILVCCLVPVTFIVSSLIKVSDEFGRKTVGKAETA